MPEHNVSGEYVETIATNVALKFAARQDSIKEKTLVAQLPVIEGLNLPTEPFIQSRVRPRRLSAASTKSEESDECLRAFSAKSRNMILTF